MDVFLSCSYFEGFCMPIAEAMLQEKPVIAYKLPELYSVYKKNIMYVKKGDTVKTVKLLKNFKKLYKLDVKASKDYIVNNYSPEVILNNLLKIVKVK